MYKKENNKVVLAVINRRELPTVMNIVKKYDKNGPEEDYGNRGNKTVINALKRFAEFVESTKSIVKVGV